MKKPVESLKGLTAAAIACAECGAPMELRTSRFGPFYGCSQFPKCRGTHGAHSDGRPLGKPATAEVREARVQAHERFDMLWKNKYMDRSAAYLWMRSVMCLTKDEAHIGNFDKAQCLQLIEAVDSFLMGNVSLRPFVIGE
jgi:ssDNA-binding Zn-finger/Zn-ribbon topoisomerase 1